MSEDGGVTQRPPAIRIERVLRGLSQEALAKAAKVSQPLISRIELGQRNPSPTTAEAIARALGVDPSSLFEDGAR